MQEKLSPNYEIEMLCAIWFHLHNLKKREKNTHGGELLLVKIHISRWMFFTILNWTDANTSRNTSDVGVMANLNC